MKRVSIDRLYQTRWPGEILFPPSQQVAGQARTRWVATSADRPRCSIMSTTTPRAASALQLKTTMMLLQILLASLALGVAAKRPDQECHSKEFRKSTAKLVKETPFIGLFSDIREQSVFEGSDIARVRDEYYVVFDR